MADQRMPVTPADYGFEIVEDRQAYKGFAKVHEFHLRHKKYDGSQSPTIKRECFNSGNAVVVLPFDAKRDEVLMVEQFRAGPLPRGDNPWVIETVAGRIDTDETAEQVAIREAVEEANCQVTELRKVGEMYNSPGIFAEYCTLFVGRADLTGLGGIHGLDGEDEDIKAMVCSFDEAYAGLSDGRLRSAPSFVLLQWLALHHDELRKAWL